MKYTGAVLALFASASSVSAYQIPTGTTRSTLRQLGQKSVASKPVSHTAGSTMKMEDFGLFRGTGIGFDDLWEGEECISETALEKNLNRDGLRYKMSRTPQEETGPMYDLPGFTVNLPLIGETYLGPPNVPDIWEALGFTATSNNEARQAEKLKAIEAARNSNKGVLGGPGKEIRKEWLDKYGYPRLVGSGGIFYADQLSTDKQPMGGFNMGKSGTIWPVPKVVESGQYGGSKGWGMKARGPAVDGLAPEKSGM